MKKYLPYILAGVAVLLCLVLVNRACRADAKYRDAKLAYEAYRALAEADHAIGQQHIEQLTATIVEKDAAIAKLNADIVLKNEKIRILQKDLADLQASEPSQPELEKEPLVINLRGQIAKLTGMFTLATGTIADKDKVIAEWSGKFEAQVAISAEWKAAYEREHGLRLKAESLFKLGEKRTGLNKLERNIAIVAGGAGIIYGLLK